MNRKYFGTDGVRGRVGYDPITPEWVMKLGWAVGRVLGQDGDHSGKVLIGKDTRVSGYLLESALQAGLSAAGTGVVLIGPMPTPGIAYLTRTSRAQAGIVISASHNPFQDNGIKFFSQRGQKLADEVESKIEMQMQLPMATVSSHELGKAERFPDAAGRYIEFCKSTIPYKLDFSDLKIVVDCANGAAYHVAPHVFTELGASVTAIANKPDGFNINEKCGSTYPQQLINAVKEQGADLGLALDGDGDRVLMVDEDGDLIDGDQILFILSQWRNTKGQLSGGVVGTLMTNLGLEQAFARQNIAFERTKVGDRYVMEQLLSKRWELGGETSGHIICLDKTSTGDGIIAALEVLQVITESGRSLKTLKQGLQIYPQNMINVRLPIADVSHEKFDVRQSEQVKLAIRDAESELADKGRVVLRPSGTEPVIRVMVEGEDQNQVTKISESLAKVVRSAAEDQ